MARSSRSSKLGENFPGRSAARPGPGPRAGAGARAAPAPLPPPAAPLPPLAARTGRPRHPVPALGREGRAGGASPRAPLRLRRPLPAARAPTQPAGGPRPSPSPLSPPPPGTMAAPSRHPLPPASLALSLPDKAGQRRGPGRGCRGSPRKGRPGRQGRDAGLVALALGLWTLTWGSALGGVGAAGGNGPPQLSPGVDGAGPGRSSRPREASAHPHGLSHIHRTHSLGSHMQRCGRARAHTRTEYTCRGIHPAHTRHRHTQLTCVHTRMHIQ